MAEERKGGLRWLKYGCFGCLGILGFFAVLGAIVSAMAYMQARSEEIAEQTATHAPPTAAELRAVVAAEDPGATAGAVENLPVGRVVLDVRHGHFRLERAAPGEPLSAEARYDQRSFSFEERYEDAPDGWTYRVSFRRKGSGILAALRQVFGGTSSRLTVRLPADTPMDLSVEMEQGAVEAELGGLWLRSGDLLVHQGAMLVNIDEPLAQPMERLSVRAGMGAFEVTGLAHASPRELNVRMNMGGLELDMDGPWLQDSQVDIDLTMAGGRVLLPDDARIVGLDSGDLRPADPEIPLPTIVFSISKDSRSEIEFEP